MTDELALRYQAALAATLGEAGRMITLSKSGYHRACPDHLPIFNASVCVQAGTIWQGDLDLTLDEPLLAALSEQLGEVVYVLYEHDGRFEYERAPRLERAVYSVAPSGHSRFAHAYIERAANGSLRARPPAPETRRRWRWRLLRHRPRPRLLRFWQLERVTTTLGAGEGDGRGRLLYLGARDGGKTPLLVLGLRRSPRLRTLALEATWYPSTGAEQRAAPRPLLDLKPRLRLLRLLAAARLLLWPGLMYELDLGYALRRDGY